MNRFVLLAAAALPLLAACGGDGGGVPPESSAERPEPPAAEKGALGFADTLIVGDPVGYIGGLPRRGQTSCNGPACTAAVGNYSARFDIRQLDPSGLSRQRLLQWYSQNGITLAQVLHGIDRLDVWGAWGTYNVGAVGIGTIRQIARYSAFVAPFSAGAASGSNPESGGASWSGVAVASELTPQNIGVRLTYDADLQLDFGRAELDLTFTPRSAQGSVSYQFERVLAWHDVLVADGAFTASGLDGRFYGPQHEEAGGVFENGLIAGAFSLRRQ